jgi:hypothetical protein
MTAVLTNVNRFVAPNGSTQPVDKSGEKFGATGGQPWDLREDLGNKRRIRSAGSQPGHVDRLVSHIPCGRGLPG